MSKQHLDKEANIVRCLLLMPSLEQLHLGFEVNPHVPSVLHRIADACRFPNLTTCTFANAVFRYFDIHHFLEQHKSSSQSLRIENCPVLDGSWISLLYWLQDNLKLSNLKVERISARTERQIWFLQKNIESDESRDLHIAPGNNNDDTRRTLHVTRHSRFGMSVVYEAATTADGYVVSIKETGEKLFPGVELTGDVQSGVAELLWDGVYIRHL